jgi:serine/threonine protein kinase/class 3 adenylate cyclase
MEIGLYRLVENLASADGVDWYRAAHTTSGIPVHLAVRWEAAKGVAAWQALSRRLRLFAQVKHSVVLPVMALDLDSQPGYAVFFEPMGESLAQRLNRGAAWPEQGVLEVGRALSSALALLHRWGLAHGGITPGHVWFDPAGEVRLQFASPTSATERTSTALRFLRDDAEEGSAIHDRSQDLFDLGTLLYRMLHADQDPGAPLDVSTCDPDAVRSLPELVEALRARDPDARPSAAETLACIERLMGASDQHGQILPTRVFDSLEPDESALGQADFAISQIPPAASPPARHEQLGRFRIVKKLGEGGLGVVYLAEDTTDGREVAIKVMHGHLANRINLVRRFRKEARLLAEVRSPHVCRLLEFNEDQGTQYLVMEYLEGVTLADFLGERKLLPEPVAVALIADVARALADAHRRGIVHRDIKPDNIMLLGPWDRFVDGAAAGSLSRPPTGAASLGVKLCDFGLARHVEQSESLDMTRTGQFMGTPLYMSPEQASGSSDITPRSDVYSLGVTLFRVLTGKVPFQANTIPALYRLHLTAEPPPLHEVNPDLTGAVCQVVRKALAKDPVARYADGADLLLDLERILRGEPTNVVVHPRLPSHAPGELLEYDWKFELHASPARLWPYVSNTERLNRAVGIPPVDYSLRFAASKDAAFPPRAERVGTFRKAGFVNTWVEPPFEWIEGRRMSVLREYSEGVFRWLSTTTELEARGDGGTTLHHRVRIVPRGLFGRVVAALEVGFKGRRAVEKVYQRIDAFLARQLPAGPATDAFEPRASNPVNDPQVTQQLLAKLAGRGVDAELAGDFVEFLLNAPEQSIARIRPIALAQRLAHDADAMIEACLYAAHEGILMILWDILCPKCRIPSAIEQTMRNIRTHGRCEACNLDFELDFANSVEMVFRVQPRLRVSETGVFCAGGPAHSPHVAAQVRVAPQERLELTLALAEGTYRLRGPQLAYLVDFRVHPQARALRAELLLTSGAPSDFPRTFRTGVQTILLHNDSAEELLVRVERLAGRADALTAARASTLACFRELFPQEVLSGNQLVSIDHVTLLTTDLAGATNLYESLGDARAFGLLHEQFRILEDHIRRESGALVKTLHEGILATFHDPAAAVRVALELHALLAENPGTSDLRLRVGVHRGPAMAATINGKLDYFGSTVRLAMKLPSLVLPGEVAITQPLQSDADVQTLLRQRGAACAMVAGSHGLPVYRVRPGSPQTRRMTPRPDAKHAEPSPVG